MTKQSHLFKKKNSPRQSLFNSSPRNDKIAVSHIFNKKNLIYLKLGLLVFAIIIILHLFNIFGGFEKKLYDLRFTYKHNVRLSPVITYIDIDDYSFAAINSKWPWTRDYYSALVDALSFGEAKAIAFDIFFDVPSSENPQYDSQLAQAISANGKVTLAFFMGVIPKFGISPDSWVAQGNHIFKLSTKKFSLYTKYSEVKPQNITTYEAYNVRFPIEELMPEVRDLGFAQVIPDKDGVTRRYPMIISYMGKAYFAMGLVLAADYLKVPLNKIKISRKGYIELPNAQVSATLREDIKIPVNKKYEMLVTWAGKWYDKQHDFPHHSFYDILREYVNLQQTGNIGKDLAQIKGKICIVGATATGLHDLNPIPLAPRYPMVGAHANVLNTILTQQFMNEAPLYINIGIVILLGLISILIFPFVPPFRSFIVFILLLFAETILNFFAFIHYNYIINLIYPSVFVAFLYLNIIIYRYMTEEKEKRVIKNTFQRYVTPTVVNELLSNPDTIKLGGDKKTLTVLFSDIRDFTSISESLAPENVVSLLNEYLTAMTNIIFKYEGMLDKYVGDEIMAVYGAPIPQSDHAFRACITAYEMIRTLHNLQKKWHSEGVPVLNIGIGLNTGPMIIGNMGSETRMDYTVMGDAVNLGARLEGTNKIYKTNIIVSEATYEQVKDRFVFRELDLVRVKGKLKPVKIFELMDVA